MRRRRQHELRENPGARCPAPPPRHLGLTSVEIACYDFDPFLEALEYNCPEILDVGSREIQQHELAAGADDLADAPTL